MNPYYVGPQALSQNPSDYMQGIQALSGSVSQGMMDAEGSDVQKAAGMGTSALQGAAAGMQIGGPVGAAIGAGVGLAANQVGSAVASNQAVKQADTGVSAFSEQYGVPVFNFEEQRRAEQEAGRLGEIGERPSAFELATSVISPVGIASQLLTNRKGAREKQRQIEVNIRSQQDRFNQANTQYQQGLLQRQAYQDRLNNVYNIPMGYF